MAANTYRPVSARARVIYGDAVIEREFTAVEEADHIGGGHLEIVPRPYRVLSNNFVAAKQDETVELALRVDQEAALIAGGHIQRVSSATSTKKKG